MFCTVEQRLLTLFDVNSYLMTVLLAFPLSGNGRCCYFSESTRCLVGCLVIISQQKTEHIYVSRYQLQCCFAVSTASLFLDFCFTVPNVKLLFRKKTKQKKTKQKKTKKAFAFLFDTPVCICCCFASAILHSSWKGSCLIQGGDAKWLEWRSCCQTQIIWENQDALDSPFLAADCLHLEGLQLPGKVNQANV